MADEPVEVEVEVEIDARPEIVFEFFTDPAKLVRWQGLRAELDPRPGGVFRVDVSAENVARGQFVELDPGRRIVFTWGWENPESPLPPGASRVEVTLTPNGDGTIVRLRHLGLPSPESRDAHERGWRHYLSRLPVAAAGGDPGPDPWATNEEEARS